MIGPSPFYMIIAEAKQEAILIILQARFGSIPAEVTTALQAIYDEEKLNDLATVLAQCRDLAAFCARVQA